MLLSVLLAFGCLASISQIDCFAVGSCAKSPVIKDFDITKYAGVWNEIERQKVFFENSLGCIKATYTVINSTFASVYNEAINLKTKVPSVPSGVAYVTDFSAPNQLLVKFSGNPIPGNYNVWDTDYKTFTLVYSCIQIIPKVLKEELIWILAREKSLDDQIIFRLKHLLNESGVQTNDFVKSIQQDCV